MAKPPLKEDNLRKNMTGVLLAAGHGTRFGGDKLTHILPNGTMLGVLAARKLATVLDSCVAVVRAQDAELHAALRHLGYHLRIQPNPDAGLGNSLALGVKASPQAAGWIITLADMPWLELDTLRQVANRLSAGAAIVAPTVNGQRGHPVGFARRFFAELSVLDGDSGAKHLLQAHAQDLSLLPVNDTGILRDVDRIRDLMQHNMLFNT
jgi:molybdenum cofactor cytidylyltransferase